MRNPEFKPLADALSKERDLRARRTPPEQRIMEGPALFDMACAATMEQKGIPHRFVGSLAST